LLMGNGTKEFSRPQVNIFAEQKLTELANLHAMVTVMGDAGVQIAKSYSDMSAPTVNLVFDKVYILLFVGTPSNSDRNAMSLLRGFAKFAQARRTGLSSQVEFCEESVRPDSAECESRLHLVFTHFDSFCEDFCDSRYCTLPRPPCNESDPEQEETVENPLSECWCSNPKTQVLEYIQQVGPKRTDYLNMRTLERPIIKDLVIDHVGGSSTSAGDALNERAVLLIDEDQKLDGLRNFQVKVIHYELPKLNDGGKAVAWQRRERLFSTQDNKRRIIVHKLKAGTTYQFEVACQSQITGGPFGPIWPKFGRLVASNRILVDPWNSTVVSWNRDVVPNWLSTELHVRLSTEAIEPIHRVHFSAVSTNASHGKRHLDCEEYKDATSEQVRCTIPEGTGTDTIVYNVTAYSVEEAILGHGLVTSVPASDEACERWEPKKPLFCKLPAYKLEFCVASCSQCTVNAASERGHVVTYQHGSTCILESCFGYNSIWCPITSKCIKVTHGSSDRSCREECSEASVAFHTQGAQVCAVPCNLAAFPQSVEASGCMGLLPGASCRMGCAEGFHARTKVSHTTFSCPAQNTVMGLWHLRGPDCVPKSCDAGWVHAPEALMGYSNMTHGQSTSISCPAGYTGNVTVSCSYGKIVLHGVCRPADCHDFGVTQFSAEEVQMSALASGVYKFTTPVVGWSLDLTWEHTGRFFRQQDRVGLYRKADRCVIAFSGTDDLVDWANNLDGLTVRSLNACGLTDVHKGFFEEFQEFVLSPSWNDKFAPFLAANCTKGVTTVGHSLGGALASVFAACMNAARGTVRIPDLLGVAGDVVANGSLIQTPSAELSLFTYGAPAVSKTPLRNLKASNRAFKGARFYNEDTFTFDPIPYSGYLAGYRHPQNSATRLKASRGVTLRIEHHPLSADAHKKPSKIRVPHLAKHSRSVYTARLLASSFQCAA